MEMQESVEKSVESFFEHFEKAFEKYKGLESIGNFTAIGMGGSGIAGKFIENEYGGNSLNTFYEEKLEKKLLKNVVLVSYSGNTWETLSWTSINDFVAMSSGGKLKEIAKEKGKRWIELPSGLAPRASFPYMITALAKLNSEKAFDDLKNKVMEAYEKREEIKERAREFSEMVEEEILIYGESSTQPQAYRAKTQLNENAKASCHFGLIPEMLHNEVEGLRYFNGTIIVFGLNNSTLKAGKIIGKTLSKKVLIYKSRGNYIEDVYFSDLLSVFYSHKKGIRGEEMDKVKIIKKIKDEING